MKQQASNKVADSPKAVPVRIESSLYGRIKVHAAVQGTNIQTWVNTILEAAIDKEFEQSVAGIVKFSQAAKQDSAPARAS